MFSIYILVFSSVLNKFSIKQIKPLHTFTILALMFILLFQYLIKYNEIKTKKGIDLLQSLVEYYHAQTK